MSGEVKSWIQLRLLEEKINISTYDPVANISELVKADPKIKLKKLKGKFDILVIAVAHKEFINLKYNKIKNYLKSNNSVFFDIKSIYKKDILSSKNIKFWSL